MIELSHILLVAGLLALIGLFGLLLRKNLVIMLMSIELMLLGAVLALVGAARMQVVNIGIADGALFVPFILIIAASEVCIGLSLIMQIYKDQKTFWVDEIDTLTVEKAIENSIEKSSGQS